MQLAHETAVWPEQVDAMLVATGTGALSRVVKIADVAKHQRVSLASLFVAAGVVENFRHEALATVELEIKYAGHFEKERSAAARMKQMGEYPLPADVRSGDMHTLSVESRQKHATRRPLSLAQAASIPGVSPADLQNLILEIERSRV
jgi:tRNA uridine 5-carboxymethylaminomethyl modification enzyme